MLNIRLIILLGYICYSHGSIILPSTLDVDVRIVGGQDAPPGSAPYQACIKNFFNKHLCGGTILSNKWVLSAAHCTSGKSKNFIKVFVGSHSLSSGGDKYSVDQIINHEKYDSKTGKNDVSVIKVSPEMKFSQHNYPILLPDRNTEAGDDLIMTGWGEQSTNGKVADNLQMLKLTALSAEECKQMSIKGTEITDAQLCAISKPGEGACVGDAGGPVVQGDYVVGIVSFGTCGRDYPEVFTRVFHYNTWIEDKTGVAPSSNLAEAINQ